MFPTVLLVFRPRVMHAIGKHAIVVRREKERKKEHARARHMSSPCRIIFSYVPNLELSRLHVLLDIKTRPIDRIANASFENSSVARRLAIKPLSGFSVSCIAILIAHSLAACLSLPFIHIPVAP